jgi:carbon monoxide dehydrogenase subunit G
MLLENSFEVPAGIDRTWNYLLDVERVVPCMPGAELTETIDDSHWKGRVTIKLGPVSMAFKGKVEIAERDDAAHRVVLKASGMEQRGKGAASATITTTAEPASSGTRVVVVQDLKVQGQAAQMSRGMMQDVSAKLTKQFAQCIEANLQAEPAAPEPAPAATGSAPKEPAPVATEPAAQPGPASSEPAPAAPDSSETRAAEGPLGPAVPVPGETAARTAAPAGAAPEGARDDTSSVSQGRPAPIAAKPVGGIGLLLSSLWSALLRGIKRLFSRRAKRGS